MKRYLGSTVYVCFLGDRSSGSVLTDRLYEFCKRSSGVDPAACDFKITAFFCKLMVDLVSIRDHSAGESIQEFPRMVRMAGRLPVKKHNGMGPAQWPVSVDPHVSLLAVFDLCMIDPHNFYR